MNDSVLPPSNPKEPTKYSMYSDEIDYVYTPSYMVGYLESELSNLTPKMEWIRPEVLSWIEEYKQELK